MATSIEPCNGECQPEDIHDRNLNKVICEKARTLIAPGQMSWYAEYVFKIPANTLSCYLSGTKPFPAWLVTAMDKAFERRDILNVLIAAADSTGPHHKAIDPRTMEKLFVMALREEGVFNAILAEGIVDHFATPDDIEHLDRELTKLMHFFVAMRERLHSLKDQNKGRTA